MERVWKGFRWLLVMVGVILLTSFSIDATDTLRGSDTALSGLLGQWSDTSCPSGTTELALANTSYCIDTYENSVGSSCPLATPQTNLDAKTNIDSPACNARSDKAGKPWIGVTYHQAKSLCAKRGMRLPTPSEWYEAALGTPADARCNIDSSGASTGYTECVSHRGAYNMVGNVWEWVDGTVENGLFNERELPAEGYVTGSAADGIASKTGSQPDAMYDNGYFWHDAEGAYVMMRGGFYGSAADASVYTTHAKVLPDFHSGAIGFRCIVEL